jgi:hypothetical protein
LQQFNHAPQLGLTSNEKPTQKSHFAGFKNQTQERQNDQFKATIIFNNNGTPNQQAIARETTNSTHSFTPYRLFVETLNRMRRKQTLRGSLKLSSAEMMHDDIIIP